MLRPYHYAAVSYDRASGPQAYGKEGGPGICGRNRRRHRPEDPGKRSGRCPGILLVRHVLVLSRGGRGLRNEFPGYGPGILGYAQVGGDCRRALCQPLAGVHSFHNGSFHRNTSSKLAYDPGSGNAVLLSQVQDFQMGSLEGFLHFLLHPDSYQLDNHTLSSVSVRLRGQDIRKRIQPAEKQRSGILRAACHRIVLLGSLLFLQVRQGSVE